MIYENPIILQDYSDPDVIRVKDDYFLVASSFNHTPVLPILHSKNLVNWRLINYVSDRLPFSRYDDVVHGAAAWAPSIRYHNGTYYVVVPFPDEGVLVASTKDPFGKWSEFHTLIKTKGVIDPCPIWTDNKCYLVVGFAKSRIGFNSMLGVYEVSPDLKEVISDYKIVYDGHDMNPTIEGPKFYYRNSYFYILAPAGSVKTGWQVALRSKNIYGPYEAKIILMQNDSPINGPHQGALVDLDDSENNYAFVHFQDKKCYGRIVHLEPVKWINDWPLCGDVRDTMLAGTPVLSAKYPVAKPSNYKLTQSDNFKKKTLSLQWQNPANPKDSWHKLDNGLILNCYYHNADSFNALNMCPNLYLQKLAYLSFSVSTKLELNLVNDYDEAGLCLMGSTYSYICVRRMNNKNYLCIFKGEFNKIDEIYYKEEYNEDVIVFNMKYTEPNIYKLGFNGKLFKDKFIASPGRWIGSKIGIYARGNANSVGKAKFLNFKVNERR